jgi:glycosyltransferase involved in cell wall biosynthesis
MIAYHYPPVGIGSGVHRSFKFSEYLPLYGWKPVVLTVHPRVYQRLDEKQLWEIPSDIHVERAFALDAAKHLAFRGSYLGITALPDRWVSWWVGGVMSGLKLIRRYRPNVIWSTYPIATAHLIGLTLARLTGIPWVADFRDSMTEENYPRAKAQRRVYRWIESHTVNTCTRAVFTAPGTLKMYADRYPKISPCRWAEIANGYDEASFKIAEESCYIEARADVLTLVHSGVVYPSERDPEAFFAALSELNAEGIVRQGEIKIVLRASGNEEYLGALIRQHKIDNIVYLKPSITYNAALSEMLTADGLLILQAASCNHQIPAKLYECLRAGRPILGLTDPEGDTAALLRSLSVDTIVSLNSKESIKSGIVRFIKLLRDNTARVPNHEKIAKYSRQARTRELANLLDAILYDSKAKM